MKRRHSRQQVIEFCSKVRSIRKDVVFGADIIAGFPTETEEMFQDSLNMIKECKLTHLHIFPYSIRKNTPAARMPQVSKDIIKKRAKILREEGNKQLQIYQVGNSAIMLVEQVKENISYGKTQHFTKIKIQESIQEGTIVKCIIKDVKQGILSANII